MRKLMLAVLPVIALSCAKPQYSYYFDTVTQPPSRQAVKNDVPPEKTPVNLIQERSSLEKKEVPAGKSVTTPSLTPNAEMLKKRNAADHSLTASTNTSLYTVPVKKLTERKVLAIEKTNKVTGKMVLGGLLIILGIILVFFGGIAEILIGTVLWLAGIFMIYPKNGTEKSRSKKSKTPAAGPEYIDVVYLKNGSIVKGTVVEQVPNEKLKIRTADGNTFEYNMTEIEKITKEKP